MTIMTSSAGAPHVRSGFTLIELLTVIAIIGILASILIPVVGRVRETARGAQCVSNLRQIGLALHIYADDNDGWLPASTGNREQANDFRWEQALGESNILERTVVGREWKPHEIFVCPSTDHPNFAIEDVDRSYAYTGAGLSISPNTSQMPRRLNDISNHTLTPLVVEGQDWSGRNRCSADFPWGRVGADRSRTSADACTHMAFRHNETMNALNTDGSVRKLSFPEWKEMPEEQWRGLPY